MRLISLYIYRIVYLKKVIAYIKKITLKLNFTRSLGIKSLHYIFLRESGSRLVWKELVGSGNVIILIYSETRRENKQKTKQIFLYS